LNAFDIFHSNSKGNPISFSGEINKKGFFPKPDEKPGEIILRFSRLRIRRPKKDYGYEKSLPFRSGSSEMGEDQQTQMVFHKNSQICKRSSAFSISMHNSVDLVVMTIYNLLR